MQLAREARALAELASARADLGKPGEENAQLRGAKAQLETAQLNLEFTFEWIRLAQRVPVRVHLEQIPDGVELRVGTTASVLVMTGTHGEESKEPVPAAPRALQ